MIPEPASMGVVGALVGVLMFRRRKVAARRR
ncbi:MAG: PEP-CTERM sorting domain-containing protein [Burkholderiales bacterium]|nr:PEP-CTERM sorting domain-containing protein [Burkholderiales bacterium]